jgi:hypothetical protein
LIINCLNYVESAIRYKNNETDNLKEERVKVCQTGMGHLQAKIAERDEDKIILSERLNQHNLHHQYTARTKIKCPTVAKRHT